MNKKTTIFLAEGSQDDFCDFNLLLSNKLKIMQNP